MGAPLKALSLILAAVPGLAPAKVALLFLKLFVAMGGPEWVAREREKNQKYKTDAEVLAELKEAAHGFKI